MGYYTDHRVKALNRWYSNLNEKKMTVTVCWGNDEHDIPFQWEVCSTCDGKGTHVNPSIDCNGISGREFAEDPDFFESYVGGMFDVACYGCGGKRVVPSPANEEDIEKLCQWAKEERAFNAEQEAERRFGC